MNVLTELDRQELDLLIMMECELLNKGYSISELAGNTFLSNSITSFANGYLKKIHGNIILSYSSEYRYFILGLLKNIDKVYHEMALREILIRTVRDISNEELLEALNKGC